MKVLFNKFHRKINLVALLFWGLIWGPEIKLRIQNFKIFSPKGTSLTNSDSEWENESFVLVAILCGNLGSRNKTQGGHGSFVYREAC
jgi:hypothetical protein